MIPCPYRFFLGGRDLEMVAIRTLLHEAGLDGQVVDHALPWGARASAYDMPIRRALAVRETPVLVELTNDLGADIDRVRLIDIDHHGARAGKNAASALRQIFELVGVPRGLIWTRHHALVDANDIGHAVGLRAVGASDAEIRGIRDADRHAQGIDAATEAESHRAVAAAVRLGALTLVRTSAPTSSAISDFLLPEYGGPGADDLLVVMPGKLAFFGRGAVIEALQTIPGGWWGGALPERGYWGIVLADTDSDAIVSRIINLLSVTN